MGRRLAACLLLAAALAQTYSHVETQAPRAQLLLVIDGLRPDYITPDVMPRLHALGRRGVAFEAHHSVFPTVTRVNSSSISTGAYPETHGLMGNTIYSQKTFPTRSINTSDYELLTAMERAEGTLLTAPTLGESLRRAGRTFLVVSAGSSGSSFLLNHPLHNGAIINPDVIQPEDLKERVVKALGPGPAVAVPNNARNRWAVDAYLSFGLEERRSDVTAIWFGDPDETAHQEGMGSDTTQRALRQVDAEIGRIEDTLRAQGLLDRTNIIVASDHGFSTHTGELQLAALVAPFARPMPDGTPDLIVTEGSINFRAGSDPARAAAIVAALQKRPDVGAIFTRPASPGSTSGIVPGTLSFNVARWNHQRSGEVLVSANWTRGRNKAGVQGTTTQGGVAGHGTSSPYDIHNADCRGTGLPGARDQQRADLECRSRSDAAQSAEAAGAAVDDRARHPRGIPQRSGAGIAPRRSRDGDGEDGRWRLSG